MSHGKISFRNACSIVILMQICNSIVVGFPLNLGPDSWISIIYSTVFAVPLMLIYGRLLKLMPGKNLYGMMEYAFGRKVSVALSVMYGLYFVSLAGIVRGDYAEFVHLTALENTSFIVICLVFFIATGYIALAGPVVIGKWCKIFVVVSLVTIALMGVFALPRITLDNLLPLMGHSFREITTGALKFLPLPIGDAILVLTLLEGLDEKASPYKVFVNGTIICIVFFAALFVITCGVLGEHMVANAYFPVYKAASVLHISSIGTRVEAFVIFVFLLAGLSKGVAGIIASAKSVSYIAKLPSCQRLILPVGLLTVMFSVIAFDNIVELFDFVEIYTIYAPLFQYIIPIAIWATVEIKRKRNERLILLAQET